MAPNLYQASTGSPLALKTHTISYHFSLTRAPRAAQDTLLDKSEALLRAAEKRQPQVALPASYAISGEEALALRCVAQERQARPCTHLRPRPRPTQPSPLPPPVTLTPIV